MNFFSRFTESLWHFWSYVSSGRTLAIVLGIGFALLAAALFVASRTKWGQSKPLTKCVVLSILAHVWLLMYALGNREVLPQGDLQGKEQNISVSFEDDFSSTPISAVPAEEPTVAQDHLPSWEQPVPLSELPKPAALEDLLSSISIDQAPELLPEIRPTPLPELPPEDLVDEQLAESSADTRALDINALNQSVLPPASDLPPSIAVAGLPQTQPVSSSSSPVLPPEDQLPLNPDLPREYQLRQQPNRLQLAKAFGADADTEAAVESALRWLASAQSEDGSWNAARFGGGTETRALGEFRHGTGDRADTGVSGLALLAFLSAGHTHLAGEHQLTVERGLRYLLHAQMPSGDLSGPKQVGNDASVMNSRMYCHSIATLAMAEAHAMTHDRVLQEALLRAAQYTINAQDLRGGGWRYRPRDPGDLSQFGWQAMALRSVQRSGIEVPVEVERRMRRFLDSCSTGSAGGLARYRPGEGMPSETMTAESLACRLMLNYPLSAEGTREAAQEMMSKRPGTQEDNVYFWYYATLALFQLQDENWRAWNQAMKARLLSTQVPVYQSEAGSWEPDPLWGGYGGRVYSTAMSCLCLEVYYRYLPMYQRSNVAQVPLRETR